MSLTHHEVSDRQVAANQSSARTRTGWIRKSGRAKPESLFETATSNIAMQSPSPIPKREAKGPTAEVASSAVAKTPEASDGAQPDRRNERPKPECNLESTTCRIADAVGRPIAKVDEPGTWPNGRNARPKPECNLESRTSRIAHAAGRPIAKVDKPGTWPNGRNARPRPECNLESTTSRIAHVVGRPIAKAGETGAGAQPGSGNEPPKPGSADSGCKYAAVWAKKSSPAAEFGTETPRPLATCSVTVPSRPGLPVTKRELLHRRFAVPCNLPVFFGPRQRIRDLRLGISALGLFWAKAKGSSPKKLAKTREQSHYVAWHQVVN